MSHRFLSIFVLALLTTVGCSKRDHKVEDIAGAYLGCYAGIAERLDVRADGRYTQSARRDGVVLYDNSGTWRLEEDGIALDGFVVAADLSRAQLLKDKDELPYAPRKFTIFHMSDNAGREPRVLIGATKTFYYFTKQANQALQHNDSSCHESCLRTPRASRGRG
jgi:hypothetical protein